MSERGASLRAKGSVGMWTNSNENGVHDDFDSSNHEHEIEHVLSRSPSGKLIPLLFWTCRFCYEITQSCLCRCICTREIL